MIVSEKRKAYDAAVTAEYRFSYGFSFPAHICACAVPDFRFVLTLPFRLAVHYRRHARPEVCNWVCFLLVLQLQSFNDQTTRKVRIINVYSPLSYSVGGVCMKGGVAPSLTSSVFVCVFVARFLLQQQKIVDKSRQLETNSGCFFIYWVINISMNLCVMSSGHHAYCRVDRRWCFHKLFY